MDREGFEFQRTTPTAMSSVQPDSPVVQTDELTRGYYDQTAIVRCQVHSLIPFTVQWYRNAVELGNKLFYRCVSASNTGEQVLPRLLYLLLYRNISFSCCHLASIYQSCFERFDTWSSQAHGNTFDCGSLLQTSVTEHWFCRMFSELSSYS